MIFLHFTLDSLLDPARSGREAPPNLAESRASLLVIAEHGQRLPEPQHALGGARRFGVVGRQFQILFGGFARTRPLKIAFAEIENRVRGELAAGVMREKGAELAFRLLILARAIGSARGVELVLGAVDGGPAFARDHGRPLRVGGERSGRRRIGWAGMGEIERCAGRGAWQIERRAR